MAVRVRYKLEVAISSDSNEFKDLGNVKTEIYSDGMNEGGCWRTNIPISTTNVQLNFPNIASAKFLVIRTTATDPTLSPVEIAIRRNGSGNEAISITPLPNAKEGILLISTTGLTSLHATNASASVAMDVTLFLAGD